MQFNNCEIPPGLCKIKGTLSFNKCEIFSLCNKQLLDEVEHDIMNYENRGLCYVPKPKAEADNMRHEVLIIHDILRKPNSIIVLLYIFHIIHPQKQKRSVQQFCFWGEHSKGLNNQADVELDMINAISAADIAFIMSSSQATVNWLNTLDQPYFLIVSVMYNNRVYRKCHRLITAKYHLGIIERIINFAIQ